MRALGEDIKEHVSEVLVEWERLLRQQPWYSLPADHRINSLPDVIVGIVDASLCTPTEVESHRRKVQAAAEHGSHRRQQGIPESLILTEYHLLRQAIWRYLLTKYGSSDRMVDAIMRIDSAITLATNASMWGYHRPEIEALGKWEAGMEKMVQSSSFLQHPR
ncbi:MAG: hypothetical protein M3P24_10405 [Gemmatimonadota bacterium]|nr:hypothetical protein [Gemmatimonadota bacterium]